MNWQKFKKGLFKFIRSKEVSCKFMHQVYAPGRDAPLGRLFIEAPEHSCMHLPPAPAWRYYTFLYLEGDYRIPYGMDAIVVAFKR
jgi:hypothetical protein